MEDASHSADRYAELEKKVNEQANEILCLKSALADCLRRLAAVESSAQAKPVLAATPSGSKSARVEKSKPSTSGTTSNGSGTSAKGEKVEKVDKPADLVSPKTPKAPSTISGKPHVEATHSNDLSKATASAAGKKEAPKPRAKQESGSGKETVSFHKDEGCVKLWLRGRALNFYIPSDLQAAYNPKASASEIPQAQQKLRLDWVLGYRGKDCRMNLFELASGELAYFVAAVAVVHAVESQSQRHYLEHTDDIKCMAIHGGKDILATGQVASHGRKAEIQARPHIRVWSASSLKTLAVLGQGVFDRALAAVAFSKTDGGALLAAVDESNEHVLSIWNWQKQTKLIEQKSSTEPVLVVEFHPTDPTTLVTCGKEGIMLWTYDNGVLNKKLGIFEKHDRPKATLSITFAAETGDVISGDSSGNLYVWAKGQNRIAFAQAGTHPDGLYSLVTLPNGRILSGGKDRRLVTWDKSYQRVGAELQLSESYGGIRTMSLGASGKLLIGTYRNYVLLADVFSPDFELVEKPNAYQVVAAGHTDELWGLATHPTQHQFATAGNDRLVTVWDALTRTAVWTKELPEPLHCIAFHPSGEVIVVGSCSKNWYVVELASHNLLNTFADGNEQIECVEFSPDGTGLALGSRDNFIYVYKVTENGRQYSKVGKCTGHSSFILHIDWSADSQFIQSNSGDYELLYWNASTCKQEKNTPAMRDVKWASANCTLQFSSVGIWPDGADGTDVNCAGRASQAPLLATGDDFGMVNLYHYPAMHPKAPHEKYSGHSSHVTSTRFLYDDTRLVSTGGKDTAVLLWQVATN